MLCAIVIISLQERLIDMNQEEKEEKKRNGKDSVEGPETKMAQKKGG
jgi:hypothetical protein